MDRRLLLATCAALAACGKTVEYPSGLLVTVRSEVVVDCIVLSAEGPDGKLQKEQAGEWRSGFRDRTLRALVYPGGALGKGPVKLVATGRRGTCDGPIVAQSIKGPYSFERRITPLDMLLKAAAADDDRDGWLVSEDCDDAQSEVHPAAPEACNDRDDDCDDSVDEGCACGAPRACFPPGYAPAVRTRGVCREGTQACTGNAYDACTDAVTPGDETCNGLDDDCDAVTDEGELCVSPQVCRAGACVPPVEVACANASDEDADGATDCADSDCAGQACGGGGTCCRGSCAQENCAGGGDEDCDGASDCQDDECLGQSCGAGRRCHAVSRTCLCAAEASSELCANAVDDDCDGKTDCQAAACANAPCVADANACTVDSCQSLACTATTAPANTCCGSGQKCSGTVCQDAVPESGGAACNNGVDDDCDGDSDCADDGCDLACPATGVRCVGGARVGVAANAEVGLALCHDGLDDDCDTKVDCADTGCQILTGEWQCTNQVDEDCDGKTDCDDLTNCTNDAITEICDNGISDDCDGPYVDCQDIDCNDGDRCFSGGICCWTSCCAPGELCCPGASASLNYCKASCP